MRRLAAVFLALMIVVLLVLPVVAAPNGVPGKPDQPQHPPKPSGPTHPPAGNVLPSWPHWSPVPFGGTPIPRPSAVPGPGAPVTVLPNTRTDE